MALKKQVLTKYGVLAEYHRIIEMRIDWFRQTATIIIGVFLNEAARREGASPLERHLYNTDEFPFNLKTDTRLSAYLFLKSLSEYTDAEDILEGD